MHRAALGIFALCAATVAAGLTTAAQTRTILPVPAPLSRPNSVGVAMGHYHFYVRDVEANARFWTTLGARRASARPARGAETSATAVLTVTDVMIVLSQGQPTGTSDGAVVNHVAFRVPSLATIEGAGLKLERAGPDLPGIATVRSPEGERIELFDNTATNVGFTPDPGITDPIADRHNKPATAPIASHHFHLYLPDEAAVAKAKAWYASTFGGTPGKRWRYDAVDLPGININFGVAPRPVQPTKGRMLDHIGFEVARLEEFTRKLESMGVTFDVRYRKNGDVGEAAFTDPWGTSIELTEGLRGR